jgi:hypothetical protein
MENTAQVIGVIAGFFWIAILVMIFLTWVQWFIHKKKSEHSPDRWPDNGYVVDGGAVNGCARGCCPGGCFF